MTAVATKLRLNYMLEIESLIQESQIVGYAGFGNWADLSLAAGAVKRLSRCGSLYHHNGNLAGGDDQVAALIGKFQKWQRAADCAWMSAHLCHHTDAEIRAILRGQYKPPPIDEGQALDRLCAAFQRVQQELAIPLHLENMAHWPLPGPDISASTGFIRRATERTGCGLVLDTAHARITASALGCDVHDYLAALPLSRVIELHVSGSQIVDGSWRSCHEVLTEVDYDLIAWILERAQPMAITLEYWRRVDLIKQQAARLGTLLEQTKTTRQIAGIHICKTRRKEET